MEKVSAGFEALGEFAPQFAHYNDDVLFGEVWAREAQLSPRDRSLITVTALMSSGILDSSLDFHLRKAKENGVTQTEIVEVLTQLGFYSGWPKAWAAFRMAKEIWKEETVSAAFVPMFGLGKTNDAYAQYFIGQSYLNPVVSQGIAIANVTFEPGCRNHWHIHQAEQGGGQILICTDGRGWYQQWGEPARALKPGDIVEIGMAPPRTAGLPIWPLKHREQRLQPNGANQWTMPSTTLCRTHSKTKTDHETVSLTGSERPEIQQGRTKAQVKPGLFTILE